MKVPAVLHASFAILVIAAAPAQAQFGDLLKKAQDTIEEVTESSLGSVSSFDGGSVASQQSSDASKGSVAAVGTYTMGNYREGRNSTKPGSVEDVTRYDIKGFSADMTVAEFKSAVAELGGTLEDRKRHENSKTNFWAENTDLTVGGFNVEKITFESYHSGSYRYPGSYSRKGPFEVLNQKIVLRFDREMSGLEMEKVCEALDRKFVGRQNSDNWWNKYEATDPDTGDTVALSSSLIVSKTQITLKHQYVEMLPPPQIASDDF